MAAKPLKRLPLACCKIYISDTRNAVALQEMESTFRAHPTAPLLHIFEDHEYNRVGYTLAGNFQSLFPPLFQCQKPSARSEPIVPSFIHTLSDALELEEALDGKNCATLSVCAGSFSTSEPCNGKTPLQLAVTDVVRTALRTIDLSRHSGSHPRLGVVDHICMHPLGTASMTDTAAIAQGIASEIGESLQGSLIVFRICNTKVCCLFPVQGYSYHSLHFLFHSHASHPSAKPELVCNFVRAYLNIGPSTFTNFDVVVH